MGWFDSFATSVKAQLNAIVGKGNAASSDALEKGNSDTEDEWMELRRCDLTSLWGECFWEFADCASWAGEKLPVSRGLDTRVTFMVILMMVLRVAWVVWVVVGLVRV